MREEVFVFDGNGGLNEVFGDGIDGDGCSVLVGIDLVEENSIAVKDLG